MRSTLFAATALLLLSVAVARAADPIRLAETGGFLLGNAHRCGVPTARVEQAGKVIHHLIAAASFDPTEEAAARGIAKLRSHGVGAGLVYDDAPKAARTYGYRGDCPEAERLSRSVFLLPSHSRLTSLERQHILRCIRLLNEITDSGDNPRRRSGGELIATAH